MSMIADKIEKFILDRMREEQEKLILKRNELADELDCAPSQINYVLTTRFTPFKGYYVESRRGGGGYIRIVKVKFEDDEDTIDTFLSFIGDSITKNNSDELLKELLRLKKVTEREMELMKVALSDRALSECENKNELRADLLKNMLLVIFS
ncbi:CtsR family transcriptional regulator [Veillonella sp.]|uniref:CtsR family transcriptional regulator n=1 Tax=Veillonella sp. TaxID=1926307 RepID=UPI002580896C|nr:CtsR family transcriptional regulator [Veillonella sp.]MBS6309427.1 CtsR family transcriptional regulator [Veillonella sp.]